MLNVGCTAGESAVLFQLLPLPQSLLQLLPLALVHSPCKVQSIHSWCTKCAKCTKDTYKHTQGSSSPGTPARPDVTSALSLYSSLLASFIMKYRTWLLFVTVHLLVKLNHQLNYECLCHKENFGKIIINKSPEVTK